MILKQVKMTCLSFNEISVSNLKIQTPGLLHPREYTASKNKITMIFILISGGLSLAQEANYMEQIIFVLAATLDISDKSLWMKILWLLASTMMLFSTVVCRSG